MTDKEVFSLWRSGIDKYKLADIYKRSYNRNVKLIRANLRHRHDGRFMTNTEALYIVERIIYLNIMKERYK